MVGNGPILLVVEDQIPVLVNLRLLQAESCLRLVFLWGSCGKVEVLGGAFVRNDDILLAAGDQITIFVILRLLQAELGLLLVFS